MLSQLVPEAKAIHASPRPVSCPTPPCRSSIPFVPNLSMPLINTPIQPLHAAHEYASMTPNLYANVTLGLPSAGPPIYAGLLRPTPLCGSHSTHPSMRIAFDPPLYADLIRPTPLCGSHSTHPSMLVSFDPHDQQIYAGAQANGGASGKHPSSNTVPCMVFVVPLHHAW